MGSIPARNQPISTVCLCLPLPPLAVCGTQPRGTPRGALRDLSPGPRDRSTNELQRFDESRGPSRPNQPSQLPYRRFLKDASSENPIPRPNSRRGLASRLTNRRTSILQTLPTDSLYSPNFGPVSLPLPLFARERFRGTVGRDRISSRSVDYRSTHRAHPIRSNLATSLRADTLIASVQTIDTPHRLARSRQPSF